MKGESQNNGEKGGNEGRKAKQGRHKHFTSTASSASLPDVTRADTSSRELIVVAYRYIRPRQGSRKRRVPGMGHFALGTHSVSLWEGKQLVAQEWQG